MKVVVTRLSYNFKKSVFVGVEIRGAARRAFDNFVDLAIDEEVDLVLLADNLCVGEWKDYNTRLYFVNRMGV